MDDFLLDFTTIFDNANTFDAFVQNIRPSKPNVGFHGAGLKQQLKHFDSVYNAKGERVLLKSGSNFNLDKDRDPASYESALILTKFWNRNGDEDYSELEIRSPHMKAAIKYVIPEYKDFNIDMDHITLRNKPRCIFHYRQELFEYGQDLQENSDAQKHLSFLLEYMHNCLSNELFTWTAFVDVGSESTLLPSLDFANLWLAFKPGHLVYVSESPPSNRSARLIEFKSMEISCKCDHPWHIPSHKWIIQGYCIDYDGTAFGYRTESAIIKNYEGYKALKELTLLPLCFRSDEKAIKDHLHARGKRFIELHGRCYRSYKGVATVLGKDRNATLFGDEDDFPLQSTWINGRIMVDCETFSEARPAHATYIQQHSGRKSFATKDGAIPILTEDQYCICHNTVAGFALSERMWGFFDIDLVKKISFDKDAFKSSLILNEEYKNMILSLVQIHQDEGLEFDDVIKGKGKGMVFLLHGEPGVGKTLTAESVADHCKKPLIRIDSSLLGTTASSVEDGLMSCFHLAERWNAVALLDEADVFLEQRSISDLERNGLVSVFLRLLEYYEGVLFLTTNRIETFDRAFKSRVHLAIHYPALDRDSRKSLWSTFLSKVSLEACQELVKNGALDLFADQDLNGRQIKNVVRIAQALSVKAVKDGRKDKDLMKNSIIQALKAMAAFEDESGKGLPTSGQRSNDSDHVGYEGAKRRRVCS